MSNTKCEKKTITFLVIGGYGFLGSKLCIGLMEKYNVVAIVKKNDYRRSKEIFSEHTLEGLKLIEFDCIFDENFEVFKVDYIVNAINYINIQDARYKLKKLEIISKMFKEVNPKTRFINLGSISEFADNHTKYNLMKKFVKNKLFKDYICDINLVLGVVLNKNTKMFEKLLKQKKIISYSPTVMNQVYIPVMNIDDILITIDDLVKTNKLHFQEVFVSCRKKSLKEILEWYSGSKVLEKKTSHITEIIYLRIMILFLKMFAKSTESKRILNFFVLALKKKMKKEISSHYDLLFEKIQ